MKSAILRCIVLLSPLALVACSTTPKPRPSDSEPAKTRAVQLVEGHLHWCVLLEDGTVKCWGENSKEQLGDGTELPRNHPVEVKGLGPASKIFAYNLESCAILKTTEVACWGNGRQVYEVRGLIDVIELVIGKVHKCALIADGSVKCWESYYGQYKLPKEHPNIPESFEFNSDSTTPKCTLNDDGAVFCAGTNFLRRYHQFTSPIVVRGIDDVVQLVRGSWHTCALYTNHEIVCVPDSPGIFDAVPQKMPELKGATHLTNHGRVTCGHFEDGSKKCLSANYRPYEGTEIRLFEDQPDLPPDRWGKHGCALAKDGRVTCWQAPNPYLGPWCGLSETPTPVPLRDATQLVMGAAHACALIDDGRVKCWGENDSGQIGDGGFRPDSACSPSTVQGLDKVVRLQASDNHTCAFQENGRVQCWGEHAWLYLHPAEIVELPLD